MKCWIPVILLPLLLTSLPVLAQAEKVSPDNQPPSTVESPSIPTQPLLLPMNGTEQVQLRLVNCGWLVDCTLARLMLPASAFVDEQQLQFDNPNLASVKVLNSAVVARGVQTKYQITNNAISTPETMQSLPANQIVSLSLKFNRSVIPPDQYSGVVYLTLANQSNRLMLPLDVKVRIGPLLPLLVLFLGIVLGRLLKYMQEIGEPQSSILGEINRLNADIAGADPEDKKALADMVDTVRKAAYDKKIEVATQQIEVIRNRLEALNALRIMEKSLKGKEQHPKVQEALGKMAVVRRSLYLPSSKHDMEAQKLLDEIGQTLPNLVTMMGSESSESQELKKVIETSLATTKLAVESPVSSIELTQQERWFERFQRSLIVLSGLSDQLRAEATFWIARPLLSLVLLVGLCAVGINSLYIENGETFGARPFSDYLGLILWGLSADVASRNLSNLQGKKEVE